MTETMGDVVLMGDPVVTSVPVHECGEPLHDTRTTTSLLVDNRKHDAGGAYALARSGLLARLVAAEARLPEGLRFLVIEGYRPPATQRHYFESYLAELTTLHPTWAPERTHAAASRYVSPPETAPHCAGAAIDLTLCTTGLTALNLGTRVNASPEESDGRCYFAADVDPPARANRDVLSAALAGVGLVNYPTEWWHWSYGDRYWAMTVGAPAALYGPVDPSE